MLPLQVHCPCECNVYLEKSANSFTRVLALIDLLIFSLFLRALDKRPAASVYFIILFKINIQLNKTYVYSLESCAEEKLKFYFAKSFKRVACGSQIKSLCTLYMSFNCIMKLEVFLFFVITSLAKCPSLAVRT